MIHIWYLLRDEIWYEKKWSYTIEQWIIENNRIVKSSKNVRDDIIWDASNVSMNYISTRLNTK